MTPDEPGAAQPPLSPHPHGVGNANPLQQSPQVTPQPCAPGPTQVKARLQCYACSRLLEYDGGAQYVQCFNCSTMNGVQPTTQIGGRVLSMVCAVCHTTNLAPYGINYVRCGTCSTISQVSHAYRNDRMGGMQSTGGPQPGLSTPRQDDHLGHLQQESVSALPTVTSGNSQGGPRDSSVN